MVHQGPAVMSQLSLPGGATGKKLAIPGSPTAVVTTPDGKKAFVLDSAHGQVIPVDLVHGTAGAPIPAGKLPTDEEMSHDGATLYVTDNLGGAVIPIDTDHGLAGPRPATRPGGDRVPARADAGRRPSSAPPTRPASRGSSPSTTRPPAWEGPSRSVRTARRRSSTALTAPPSGWSRAVWATSPAWSSRSTCAPRRLGRRIAVGHGPTNPSMSPDGHVLVVPNTVDRTVSIVDLHTRAVVATVPVGAGPLNVEITADGATAWVVCVARPLARARRPAHQPRRDACAARQRTA